MLKPLRYKVGGPSEVYASSRAAVFCAGMNPLSLKDLLKGCLLVAFFEKPPVLPFLIKRAALGNLKANFHCAHFAQPFSSGYRGCTNRPFNSLYDPFGSPCRGQKRRSEPFHSMVGGPSEVYASSRAADFCAGMNPPCGRAWVKNDSNRWYRRR